jgi:hypothetical protein
MALTTCHCRLFFPILIAFFVLSFPPPWRRQRCINNEIKVKRRRAHLRWASYYYPLLIFVLSFPQLTCLSLVRDMGGQSASSLVHSMWFGIALLCFCFSKTSFCFFFCEQGPHCLEINDS